MGCALETNFRRLGPLGDPAHPGYGWFGCLSYIGHHQEARVVPGKISASTTVALVVLPRKVFD